MAHSSDTLQIGRRQILVGAAAMVVAGAGCSRGGKGESASEAVAMERPAGVPLSRYGAASTAEEVTSGLDLTGRTALVTGATSGLGLETLRVLALRGAHVIATGRTLAAAEAACRSVGRGRATPLGFDLQDWAAVAAAAATVRAMGRPLDMLICNAGIMAPPALTVVNGVEQQFAVNHLGHFVLCHHLLDAVLAAPQGRVVVVSSRLHENAPPAGIDFDNLSGQRGYDPGRMYGQSKLANALFAFELARRLSSTRATANALHPGVVDTDLGRSRVPWRRLAGRVRAWALTGPRAGVKSVDAGAATQVYLATAPALERVTGQYFEDCNPIVPASPHMRDRELAARLWDRSTELTQPYLS